MRTLAELRIGDMAYVTGMAVSDALEARLRDLGLVEGTPVYCRLIAPSGSPVAFEVRGALLALRRSDAEKIYCRGEMDSG